MQEFDDSLGAPVAGGRLGAEQVGGGVKFADAAVPDAEIGVQNREAVQQLALVLVQALGLDVENGAGVQTEMLFAPDVVGELLFLCALYGEELPARPGVAGERLQAGDLGKIRDPAAPDALREKGGQLPVAQGQPAPLGHAVGLVAEALRVQRVPLGQHAGLEELRVDFRHAVGRMRPVNGHAGHVDAPPLKDVVFCGVPDLPVLQLFGKPALQHCDIGVHRRQHALKEVLVPGFQRFRHQGVVGVGERVARRAESGLEVHAARREQAQQLWDGDRGVRVVELDGIGFRKMTEVASVRRLVGGQQGLQRGAGKEILLLEPQAPAGVGAVVRVQHGGDRLGLVPAAEGFAVLLPVERFKIQRFRRLRLPQPQVADRAPAVPDDRHVVGHRPHALPAELHADLFLLAALAPRVAPGEPVVRRLFLEAVGKALPEQPVPVADAPARERDAERGGAVEKTGCQPAQAAAAEGVVPHFLQCGGADAGALQQRFGLVQQPEVQQVAVDHPPEQELRGKIARRFAGGGFFPAAPARAQRRPRNGGVELFRGGAPQAGVEFLLQLRQNRLLKRLHENPPCFYFSFSVFSSAGRRPYRPHRPRIRAASRAFSRPGRRRQRQLPPTVAGRLMRAPFPRPSQSCIGMMAVSAALAQAARTHAAGSCRRKRTCRYARAKRTVSRGARRKKPASVSLSCVPV